MPEGPFGGPRPIANSSVKMKFLIDDEFKSVPEIVVESKLRDSIPVNLRVTVNESFDVAGEEIWVIVEQQEVDWATLSQIVGVVEGVAEYEFSDREISVICR